MKEPSSPMDVCPFCGKAFKRLKSHLPHCKMAQNKKPKIDDGDKNITTNQMPMKGMKNPLPVVEKQNPKIKEWEPKRQVRQDKTILLSRATQSKVGKVATGNTLTQKKAAVTIGHVKKAPQTTTSTHQMVTSQKEQNHIQVALTEPNSPILQDLMLRPMLESPSMSSALPTVRDQIWTENVKVDKVRPSLSEQMSEEDTVKNIRVQGHVQVSERVHLEQSSVPKDSMVFSRVQTEIPVIYPNVCHVETEMRSTNVLETEKSTEMKMDVPHQPKTVQTADGPLGLQWTPQLYSNYIQLRIVPGRQDQWDPYGRGTNTQESIPRRLELCKSVLENQSTPKRFMDVRLGELPNWFVNQRYTPKNILKFMEKDWGRYYNKYINVKKGGVGGLTMLLAGYCVLSYSWNYDHIKLDRWRKYH